MKHIVGDCEVEDLLERVDRVAAADGVLLCVADVRVGRDEDLLRPERGQDTANVVAGPVQGCSP